MEDVLYKIISIFDIPLESRFVYRQHPEDQAFRDSIKFFKILNPLITSRPLKGEVIAGHRRLAVAKALGFKKIPVLEIQKATDLSELFSFAVISNWNSVLSESDRIRAMDYALNRFKISNENLIAQLLPALGLRPDSRVVSHYLGLSRLHPRILDCLERENLPFRGVESLGSFSFEEQERFALLASDFAFTSSQLRQFAEWTRELKKIQHQSLDQILEGLKISYLPEFQDKRQRTEWLMEALKRMRYPKISEAETQFLSEVRKIQNGAGSLKIESPAFFEQEGFYLRLHLKSPQDLDSILNKMNEKRSLLNSLFNFML